MKLTKQQLEEIERLAGLFFSIKEVALIIGVNTIAFSREVKTFDTVAYQHYNKGRLLKEAEIRTTTMTMAKQGSTPALNQAIKLWQEQQIKNL